MKCGDHEESRIAGKIASDRNRYLVTCVQCVGVISMPVLAQPANGVVNGVVTDIND